MFHVTRPIAAFLCFAMLYAGCDRTWQDAGKDGHGAVQIAFEAMPGRIDPRFSTDAYSARLGGLLFASLVLPSANGGLRPYLARSWRWEDERTIAFELSDDFAFANGTPVTATDVAATYSSVLAPASGSPRRAALEQVLSVEALPGGKTVRFHLAGRDSAFFEGASLGILPASQARAGYIKDADLISSGPYRIIKIEHNHSIELGVNPSFRHHPVPIERVDIRVVPDALTRALELIHGSLDLVQNAIDPDSVDWLTVNHPSLIVSRSPSANLQYLGVNIGHPPLAQRNVRRAIASAIDKATIVEHLLAGQARVADSFLPPEHWAHSRHLIRHGYDPDRARKLLDDAGWRDPDGAGPAPRLTLSYKTTTDDLSRRIAEALASQLANVGIQLDIRSYDWATFFADIRRGEFHLYSLQWVGIGDPDILRQVLHSSMTPPMGNNRGAYRDTRIDRLTERGRRVLKESARRRVYARVERRAARTLPFISLWWPERVVVMSPRLAGFLPHPAGDLQGLLNVAQRPRHRAP